MENGDSGTSGRINCVGNNAPCAPGIASTLFLQHLENPNEEAATTSTLGNKNKEDNIRQRKQSSYERPKTRSQIYNLFSFNTSKNTWKCNNCKTTYKNSGGPSTLWNHIKRSHPCLLKSLNEDEEDSCQILLTKKPRLFQQKSKPKPKEPLTESRFKDLVVKFIVESNQPFTLVEEEGFKNLIDSISRNEEVTKVPGSTTVKEWIKEMYKEEYNNLKLTLQKNESKISFTIDCWTSANQYPFQGIVATWIDNEWTLCNSVLDLTILKGSHTGKNIASAFIEILEEFELLSKLGAIVSDSASNMDKACQEIESTLKESLHQYSADKQRIRCFAHILNLTCQAILQEVGGLGVVDNEEQNDEESSDVPSTLIQKLRKCVRAIRGSPQRRETFCKQCEIAGVESKNLVLDVKTRWNSTYLMIERACELKNPLLLTLSSHRDLRYLSISDSEWETLQELMDMLRPFKDFTEMFSTEKHPTMSEVTAVYNIIFKQLEEYMDSNKDNVMQNAAKKGWEKLKKYYPTCDGESYIISTVLDPRCKMKWYSDNKWRSNWLSNCKRTVKRVWTEKYKPPAKPIQEEAVEYASIFNNKSLFGNCNDSAQNADELQRYLSLPRVSPSVIDADPAGKGILSWWQIHQNEFPYLAKMATDYLAIPSSAVSVERLFSNGPDLISHRRESLKPETIRMCICLKNWLSVKRKKN